MANDEATLKDYLKKYTDPVYTANEVILVTQRYRGLIYRLEGFVFNNGVRKDLINLAGTIPVVYRGADYNIPVCIWLMDTHPQHSPLCFVKPTPDMCIKVSKYVDNDGKVYLPYLHTWAAKNSTLLKLIQCMIAAFGEMSPVYSKPRDASMIFPSMGPFIPSDPRYPNVAHYPQSSNLPYPSFGTPYPGSMPDNGTPYPPVHNTPYPPAATTGYPTTNTAGGTITEEHIKASLLSAVEDKLKRRLKEQSQQSNAELDTLKRTQQELREGKVRLEDILVKLQRERGELDKNVAILQEKEKELQAAIERLGEQEGVDIDEAVITTAPLYSQLLNAFAEEATLEDAIYYMGEALRKEVIDLDTFLKQVRALARRQFTLRALMQKCRQKAQLAC